MLQCYYVALQNICYMNGLAALSLLEYETAMKMQVGKHAQIVHLMGSPEEPI